MNEPWKAIVSKISISVGPSNVNRKIAVVDLHTGMRGPKGDKGDKGDPGTGGSGGGSEIPAGSLTQESILITSGMIAAKQLTLVQTPTQADTVAVIPDGGGLQTYGVDFTIFGTVLSWNGLGLESQLQAGDLLFLKYYVGGLSSSIKREALSITSGVIAAKQMTLLASPLQPSAAIVVPVEGILQNYGIDFIITGNVISWNGLGMEEVLVAGDVLQVEYFV